MQELFSGNKLSRTEELRNTAPVPKVRMEKESNALVLVQCTIVFCECKEEQNK